MKHKKSFSRLESELGTGSDCRPRLAMQRDILRSRSKFLNRTDQILIHLVTEGHYTNLQLADLLGISQTSLTYHINRLKKILGRDFLTLFRQPRPSGSDEWKIARMAYLKGLSLHTIASHTGLSLYRVRKITAKLKTAPVSNDISPDNPKS